MKIVNLDGNSLNPGDLSWEPIAALGELTVHPFAASSEAEIIERIGDAEIVIGNKVTITRSILERCPSIRLICVLATGYNMVDTQAAREMGIPVCNVPTYGTQMVAQFAIGLLLELCHHAWYHHETVQAGEWERCPSFCYWKTPIIELAGKTMGIIGFGRIGQAVGRIAKALGMEVLATGSRPTDQGRTIAEYVDLDTLLSRSDVISLHCPLLPGTEGIINTDTIAKMKEGVLLVNNSRGGLVDEDALAQALRSGKVRAAAVDVVSQEPILGTNPLLNAPNCMITPHISWTAAECRRRIIDITASNIRSFLAGSPQNVVNS